MTVLEAAARDRLLKLRFDAPAVKRVLAKRQGAFWAVVWAKYASHCWSRLQSKGNPHAQLLGIMLRAADGSSLDREPPNEAMGKVKPAPPADWPPPHWPPFGLDWPQWLLSVWDLKEPPALELPVNAPTDAPAAPPKTEWPDLHPPDLRPVAQALWDALPSDTDRGVLSECRVRSFEGKLIIGCRHTFAGDWFRKRREALLETLDPAGVTDLAFVHEKER